MGWRGGEAAAVEFEGWAVGSRGCGGERVVGASGERTPRVTWRGGAHRVASGRALFAGGVAGARTGVGRRRLSPSRARYKRPSGWCTGRESGKGGGQYPGVVARGGGGDRRRRVTWRAGSSGGGGCWRVRGERIVGGGSVRGEEGTPEVVVVVVSATLVPHRAHLPCCSGARSAGARDG